MMRRMSWRCRTALIGLFAGVGLVACGNSGSADDDDDGNGADATVPPPPPPAVCDDPPPLVDTSAPAHVVGDGTAGSCTPAALEAAVAAGGTIAFACGGPATITLARALVPTLDTVLDGGGQVTLSGGNTTRLITMDTGSFEARSPHLTVQRITLRDGHATGPLLEGGGGAIYFVGGSVTAIDATFLDNRAELTGPDVAGGAIFAIGAGELIIGGSRFAGNRASNGGAIGVLGAALRMVNTSVVDNTATGSGANYVENDVQLGMGGNGGGLSMDGQGRALYLCGSTFQGNSSGAFGGAIFRTGYASEPNEVHRSAFLDNRARDRTDELPSGAGALYLQGVRVTMTASTVAGNQALGAAGVWILGHGAAAATADLTNVTITGNATYPRAPLTERGVAAGLNLGDNTTGTLTNVTITGNAGQFGSGIWNASALTIRNSIIANDADNLYTPLNCTGSSYESPPATGTNNVQWPTGLNVADDMDCTPGIVRVDPQMGGLADHGGPTPTVVPGATGLPRGTDCPAIDQRGRPRATGDCAIGAVEP